MSATLLKRLAAVFAVQMVCLSALLLLDHLPDTGFWRNIGIGCFAASFLIPCVCYIYALKAVPFWAAAPSGLRVIVIGIVSFLLTVLGVVIAIVAFTSLGFHSFAPHD
jgi:hypothetical protein